LRFTPAKISELLTGSFSVHDIVSFLDQKVQDENMVQLAREDEILERGRKKGRRGGSGGRGRIWKWELDIWQNWRASDLFTD
jgi:hypothetical protein